MKQYIILYNSSSSRHITDSLMASTSSEIWVGMSNPNLIDNCWDSSNTDRDPVCDNDVFYWVDGTPVASPRGPW